MIVSILLDHFELTKLNAKLCILNRSIVIDD